MVERHLPKVDVAGSSPVIRSNKPGEYGYKDNVYGHSTIIVNKSGTNVFIAERTSKSSYNCNVKLKERFPIATNQIRGSGGRYYRLICLKAPA